MATKVVIKAFIVTFDALLFNTNFCRMNTSLIIAVSYDFVHLLAHKMSAFCLLSLQKQTIYTLCNRQLSIQDLTL